MNFVVTIDRDEDGAWVVECPSIPGCVSQGMSRDEALENIRKAISLCLEVRAERGMPLTVETKQVEVAMQTCRPASGPRFKWNGCGESLARRRKPYANAE